MMTLSSNYKDIIKQSLFISSSRLILLLIPAICLSVISSKSLSAVGDYTLANQYIQILVIILISINIGSNIIISRNLESYDTTNKIVSYLFIFSLILTLFFFAISYFLFKKKFFTLQIFF
ncbi:hypothetical protein CEP45_04645 [Mergibacter septicus]|nr:hypothetical protein CEP45_04645 [Mergibacter septicus]